LAIINIQLEKNTNQCKDARAFKEPEGCRVDAPVIFIRHYIHRAYCVALTK